jgi:hypothetical protein
VKTSLPPWRTLLAAALLLPACGAFEPAPDTGGPLAVLGEKRAAWEALDRAAHTAYEAGRWEESAARHEEKFPLLPVAAPGAPLDERVETILQTDLYNIACCRALSGKKAEALDALERAFRDGCGAIGFDHLVQDPDLESLHGEDRWKSLISSVGSDLGLSLVGSGKWKAARVPVVVELLPAGTSDSGQAVAPEAATVWPRPPFRLGPKRASWTSRLDWGEHAAKTALRSCARATKEWDLVTAPRVLKASGPEMVGIAWEILLRRPEAFTYAVLDGPAPPARVLLDRGAEKVKTAILVADAKGVPDARVGVRVEVAGSAEEALRRALR